MKTNKDDFKLLQIILDRCDNALKYADNEITGKKLKNIPVQQEEMIDDYYLKTELLQEKIAKRMSDLQRLRDDRSNGVRDQLPTFSGDSLEYHSFRKEIKKAVKAQSSESETDPVKEEHSWTSERLNLRKYQTVL